jgi:hypothetical protein
LAHAPLRRLPPTHHRSAPHRIITPLYRTCGLDMLVLFSVTGASRCFTVDYRHHHGRIFTVRNALGNGMFDPRGQ